MSSSEVYASYEAAREAYKNAVDIYLATHAADDLDVTYKAFQAAIAALPKSRRHGLDMKAEAVSVDGLEVPCRDAETRAVAADVLDVTYKAFQAAIAALLKSRS
jgi:hypothetical protein